MKTPVKVVALVLFLVVLAFLSHFAFGCGPAPLPPCSAAPSACGGYPNAAHDAGR